MPTALILEWMLVTAMVLNAPIISAYGQDAPSGEIAAPVPKSQQVRDFSDATLSKVVPGRTTKAQVRALLGSGPWRMNRYDDETLPYPGDPSVDIWEYRGRDSNGTYRVHIEFDANNITTLIAKIPDKTGIATARVAKPPPEPGKP
jgi:outer membrane protein assembly factor BamE (lipoprotein component of BamABCDE complex)